MCTVRTGAKVLIDVVAGVCIACSELTAERLVLALVQVSNLKDPLFTFPGGIQLRLAFFIAVTCLDSQTHTHTDSFLPQLRCGSEKVQILLRRFDADAAHTRREELA